MRADNNGRTPDSELMVIKAHPEQFGPTRHWGLQEVSYQLEPDAEVSPRFSFEISIVAVGRILSRIQIGKSTL